MEATEWYHGRCVDVSCGHVWLQPENSFWLLTATDGYCKLRAIEPDWRKCEAVAAWMAHSIQHHAATPTLIQPYPPAANATQDHPTTDPPPLPYYHTQFVPTSTSHPSLFHNNFQDLNCSFSLVRHGPLISFGQSGPGPLRHAGRMWRCLLLSAAVVAAGGSQGGCGQTWQSPAELVEIWDKQTLASLLG